MRRLDGVGYLKSNQTDSDARIVSAYVLSDVSG
jgi:hypothetical protein